MAGSVRGEPVDFSTLPDFCTSIRPALEALKEQYPVLASAPAIIQQSLLFPYVEGACFVLASWQEAEGRPPPFGEYLPQSTEQILDPDRGPLGARDDPTELLLSLGGGVQTAYQNTLGEMEVQILLDELLGEGHRGLADGWDGDRFALVMGVEGDGDGLIWASVWDSAEERDAFVSGLQPGVRLLPAPATLTAAEILGRPGALLRVGLDESVAVTVTEGSPR
jgi:hypothetical protein